MGNATYFPPAATNVSAFTKYLTFAEFDESVKPDATSDILALHNLFVANGGGKFVLSDPMTLRVDDIPPHGRVVWQGISALTTIIARATNSPGNDSAVFSRVYQPDDVVSDWEPSGNHVYGLFRDLCIDADNKCDHAFDLDHLSHFSMENVTFTNPLVTCCRLTGGIGVTLVRCAFNAGVDDADGLVIDQGRADTTALGATRMVNTVITLDNCRWGSIHGHAIDASYVSQLLITNNCIIEGCGWDSSGKSAVRCRQMWWPAESYGWSLIVEDVWLENNQGPAHFDVGGAAANTRTRFSGLNFKDDGTGGALQPNYGVIIRSGEALHEYWLTWTDFTDAGLLGGVYVFAAGGGETNAHGYYDLYTSSRLAGTTLNGTDLDPSYGA